MGLKIFSNWADSDILNWLKGAGEDLLKQISGEPSADSARAKQEFTDYVTLDPEASGESLRRLLQAASTGGSDAQETASALILETWGTLLSGKAQERMPQSWELLLIDYRKATSQPNRHLRSTRIKGLYARFRDALAGRIPSSAGPWEEKHTIAGIPGSRFTGASAEIDFSDWSVRVSGGPNMPLRLSDEPRRDEIPWCNWEALEFTSDALTALQSARADDPESVDAYRQAKAEEYGEWARQLSELVVKRAANPLPASKRLSHGEFWDIALSVLCSLPEDYVARKLASHTHAARTGIRSRIFMADRAGSDTNLDDRPMDLSETGDLSNPYTAYYATRSFVTLHPTEEGAYFSIPFHLHRELSPDQLFRLYESLLEKGAAIRIDPAFSMAIENAEKANRHAAAISLILMKAALKKAPKLTLLPTRPRGLDPESNAPAGPITTGQGSGFQLRLVKDDDRDPKAFSDKNLFHSAHLDLIRGGIRYGIGDEIRSEPFASVNSGLIYLRPNPANAEMEIQGNLLRKLESRQDRRPSASAELTGAGRRSSDNRRPSGNLMRNRHGTRLASHTRTPGFPRPWRT